MRRRKASQSWRVEGDQGRASPRPAFLPALPVAPLATGRQAQPNGRCAGPNRHLSTSSAGAQDACPSRGRLTAEGQARELAAE